MIVADLEDVALAGGRWDSAPDYKPNHPAIRTVAAAAKLSHGLAGRL